MTYDNPTDAQLAAREAMKKRRTEGTLEAFLEGKARVQPLFRPEDHTKPYDDDDSRHGTLSAYTQGCRCPWCRLAGKDSRSYKKAGLKLPKGYNARWADGDSDVA